MHLDGSEFTVTPHGQLVRLTVQGATGGRHVTALAAELLALLKSLMAEVERLMAKEA